LPSSAISGRQRPEGARDAQHQLAHEGPAGQRIELVALARQAKPDLAVQAARQVVRIAGQIVEEDPRLRRAAPHVQPVGGGVDAPHAVTAAFAYKQGLFVGG
jgi:hypothetical protein